MSIELIGGAIALILALVGGGVGWSQVRKHGRVLEERDEAREERDAWKEIAERRGKPLENADERRLSAAAELLRRGVRDD